MHQVAPPLHEWHSPIPRELSQSRDANEIAMAPPLSTSIDVLLAEAQREFMRFREDRRDDETVVEVVIAPNVTPEDFALIPEESLDGLVVELREGRALVLVEVLSAEQSTAKQTIGSVAMSYADANPGAALHVTADDGNDGANGGGAGGNGKRNPDILLCRWVARKEEPLVAFIVGVVTPGCPEMIRLAAHYFRTIPSLVLVVGFQFFRARVNPNSVPLLEIPALVVAFERGNLAATGQIRVLDARSFGNADLDGNIVNHDKPLASPATHGLPPGLPLEPFPAAAGLNHDTSTGVLHLLDPVADMRAWGPQQRVQPMVLPMPGGLPSLELPLYQIFCSAVRGWIRDASTGRLGA